MQKDTAKTIFKQFRLGSTILAAIGSTFLTFYGFMVKEPPPGPAHWLHQKLTMNVPLWSYFVVVLAVLLIAIVFQFFVWYFERAEHARLSKDEATRILDLQQKELQLLHIKQARMNDEYTKMQEDMVHLYLDKQKDIDHEQEILAVRRQLEKAEEESQKSREKFELHATDQEDFGRALRIASSVTYIARTCLREILEDQYAQTVDAIVRLDDAFLKGSRETEEAFFGAFEAGRTAFLEPEELRGEMPSGGRKLMAYHAGTIYERLYRICLFADFFSAMPDFVMEAHLEDPERDFGEIVDRYWKEFGKHFPTETHEQHEGDADAPA